MQLARPALLLIPAALLLAGCATAAPGATPTPTAAGPVEVTNCGTEVVFDAAPERVVTIKSTSTEMLLALGLGDRIVGTAFQDGPVPEQWAADATDLVSIADKVPSEEVVLELEPDLVYAGWESNFSPEGAGERAELASLGVNSYVSPSACQSADQPAKLSFENVFGDIQQVADIFRVDAAPLIAEQRAALEAIEPAGDGRTALWFSSGSDTPYVGAGIGAPQLVLETVGLENIAGDIDATWAPFNWEAVVDADPDFIVLVDATWNDVAKKIGILESNPATANLTAVKEGKYLIVPFAAGEAGVRSVEAAVSLNEQIAELDG
ncbi:putative F420-0 ABC transporter substrate-binding protein [Leifsonia sp. H3M29-4]|uniref:putative F420-0 ABC transporter substrate-binding protein n=1 Tax=Salinibacterium metalliresistens TaxID=3031321 RepID=UPI0023DBCC0D|nr:putative F420-0 ABC transporter substrate-binding protein [Salinibacterium metalliresistens]MDF1479611.1 putative F420-0 ABC transporter substrate-binding protein [Salinibacterium metalliresistens]